MGDHRCNSEPCLYCMVTVLYDNIETLKDDRLRLATEVVKLKRGKEEMDEQIKKVKKDIDKGNKKKGEKDVKKLLKMDKKFDAKLEKCDMKMKKKK